METTPDSVPDADSTEGMQPLRDADATTTADPAADPTQAEWERTQAMDEGRAALDASTATGGDPDEMQDPEDEIPAQDLPPVSE